MSKRDVVNNWPYLNPPVTGNHLPETERAKPVLHRESVPMTMSESVHAGMTMDGVDRSDALLYPDIHDYGADIAHANERGPGRKTGDTAAGEQQHGKGPAVSPRAFPGAKKSGISSHGGR